MKMKMTMKNAGLYNSYLRSYAVTLRDVYKSPSDRKVRAEELIMREMAKMNGFDPRIVGSSCHYFSMAFTYPDTVTGELRLRYYTGRNTYDFLIVE